MEYQKNHYVAKFLLRKWHGGPDNRLTLFQRQKGALYQSREVAAGVCTVDDLYTTHTLADGTRDVSIERDFFGRHVDTPAALAHRAILDGGIRSVNDVQRSFWVQFLVAQYLRVPRTLRSLDAMADSALDAQLENDPNFARQLDPTTTLNTRDWVREFKPQAYRQLSRGGLPAFIQQGRLFDEMRQGYWDVRRLSLRCPYTLLIADHPLIVRGTRQDGYEVMLPLSPRVMFVKSPDPVRRRELLGGTDEGFAKRANLESLRFASRYVVASDDCQYAVIDRHLRLEPDT